MNSARFCKCRLDAQLCINNVLRLAVQKGLTLHESKALISKRRVTVRMDY